MKSFSFHLLYIYYTTNYWKIINENKGMEEEKKI